MSYKVKSNTLTSKIKAVDDQLQIDENNIFGRKNIIYLIIGKKGSGKTTLLLNLFNTAEEDGGFKKRFDKIFLVSPTALNDPKMDELAEELQNTGGFYSDINNDVVQEILDTIDTIKGSWKKKSKPEFAIIFDDTIHNLPSSRKRGQAFNKLMTTNRHFKTSVFILSQRLNELNPLVRSQADVISFFRADNKKEDEIFMDTYGITKEQLQFCFKEPNSFITVSYLHGKPKVYCRFDEIEK